MELKHQAAREGRLSSFLRGEMKMSLGLMNRLKWGDGIRVNGVPRHTDYAVQPGDVITVMLEAEEAQYPAEPGELSILYEDEYILAVDKPAGMLIHPSHSRNSGTLANIVQWYYREKGIQSAFHPLTRLDRDTFGVVLLGKNAHISQLLQAGHIRKTYHALTYGGPATDSGTIDLPIARKPLPSLLREIRADGKPSLTEFRVLERNAELCKLELRPVTGRTHQLRLHCAVMGFPIVGDPQYGSEISVTYSEKIGVHTQLLCAKSLELDHPVTGTRLRICSRMDVML